MDWNEFLRETVAEKDVDLVRQALVQGANPNHRDEDDPRSETTPLYWAVFGGHVEIAGLLLGAGARIANEAGAEGSSLHAAVENRNLPMVNLLLEYDGAVALNWFDYVDRTPLMIAVEMEDVAMARRLIEAGADVNAHDAPRAGDTALHVAASNGMLEMVELLLHAGADPTIRSWMWITPLDNVRGRKRGNGPRIFEMLEQAAKRF